jgi:hypothetical protein
MAVMPEPATEITAHRSRARKLFKALTGVALPIDDKRLKEMETKIAGAKEADAVKVATADPLFYRVRVSEFAKKMSNHQETVRVPLNDFTATIIGVVRDSDTTSAKELLTGNFFYRGKTGYGLPMVEMTDFINSNNHYADIETKGLDPALVLERVNGQRTVANNARTTVINHPDPAGLLTSRSFMEAHAVAGTNRRLIEYAFRQFMCKAITDWADNSAPDDHVGRDIDRLPGGSNVKFQTTCKSCHGQMDALRPAFAKVDFIRDVAGGVTRAVYVTDTSSSPSEANVASKFARNSNVFPQGYAVKDTKFVNYATEGANHDGFGWRGSMQGQGLKEFGAMVAESQGFSRCLVRRVFASVCRRDPTLLEEPIVRRIADDFEQKGYHLRGLFETVSLRPECLSK